MRLIWNWRPSALVIRLEKQWDMIKNCDYTLWMEWKLHFDHVILVIHKICYHWIHRFVENAQNWGNQATFKQHSGSIGKILRTAIWQIHVVRTHIKAEYNAWTIFTQQFV